MIRKIINKFKKTVYNFFNCGISYDIDKFVKKGGIIGEGCEVYPNVEFGSEPYLINIGNCVRITSGVRFITHDGGVWTLRKSRGLNELDVFGKIVVGDNTHIGWNAIIMPNVTIGKNCIIGSGDVVTHDIEDNSVAVGVPARVIETIDEYYNKVIDKSDNTKSMNWNEKKDYLLQKYNEIK